MHFSRARTPDTEDLTVKFEVDAYKAHDRLIELGGRPTRPVRPKPIWETTLVDGKLFFTDSDTGEEKCHEEKLYSFYYWDTENSKFGRELARWQDFRKSQHKAHKSSRIKGTVSHLPPEEYEEPVTKGWIRLRDWQEFQAW